MVHSRTHRGSVKKYEMVPHVENAPIKCETELFSFFIESFGVFSKISGPLGSRGMFLQKGQKSSVQNHFFKQRSCLTKKKTKTKTKQTNTQTIIKIKRKAVYARSQSKQLYDLHHLPVSYMIYNDLHHLPMICKYSITIRSYLLPTKTGG